MAYCVFIAIIIIIVVIKSYIIDYMYSQKTNSEEMNSALDYTKHSYNIKFVTNRIRHIFEEPDFINREKELYYLETFCTDEMMGKSFDLFYKWYFAIISYFCSSNSCKCPFHQAFQVLIDCL